MANLKDGTRWRLDARAETALKITTWDGCDDDLLVKGLTARDANHSCLCRMMPLTYASFCDCTLASKPLLLGFIPGVLQWPDSPAFDLRILLSGVIDCKNGGF
jgi:hypothetical protein